MDETKPHRLRGGLARNGYAEISVTSGHAAAAATLPPLHKDPFYRMRLAQAIAERLILLTADSRLAGHPRSIRKV